MLASRVLFGGSRMRRRILSRYARTADGEVIIDVAAGRVQDLYEDFDRVAPYLKKDLDQDLTEYLADRVREIGRMPFIIRINLSQKPSDDLVCRVRESIRAFFLYLRESEGREVRRMMRRSIVLLSIGFLILGMAIWTSQALARSTSVISQVFAEGLTVAAWVSLWEAVANFLIHWGPHRHEMALFSRLAKAPVQLIGRDELTCTNHSASAEPSRDSL